MHTLPLHRLLVFSLLVCGAVLSLAAARAQQIVNGSFELDVASTTTPNAGTGWMNLSNPQQAYVYNNSFAYGSTSYGSQWLNLQNGQVSQTIASGFVVGQSYELHFSSADTQGGNVPSISAFVASGTTTLAQATFSMPQHFSYFSNTPIAFTSYTLAFVPTSTGPITFSIGNDSYPAALDNVYLVPEPSAWSLLGLGAASWGVATLRRRRAIA